MDSISRGGRQLRLEQGDITRVAADAIVNAANSALAGGGGVDGAIHRAGGPSILAEGRAIVAQRGPVSPGSAATTGGGSLPAQFVIHAVGPIWHGGSRGEAGLLKSAYEASLVEAERHGAHRVAFPSISTGAYGYPVREAAEMALVTVLDFLEHRAQAVEDVVFVLYDGATYAAYRDALARLS